MEAELKVNKIYGVGINDDKNLLKLNKNEEKCYKVWRSMLQRCYDKKLHLKQPTYIGCTVCDEWLYFSNFKKWFDENYKWDLVERGIKLNLDKDLLSDENNRIYSPNTCIFLPQKVNRFLTNKKRNNSSGFTGVSWHKKYSLWRARIHDFYTHKDKHLGYFNNPQDAYICYIKARLLESIKAKDYMRSLGYCEDIIEKIK